MRPPSPLINTLHTKIPPSFTLYLSFPSVGIFFAVSGIYFDNQYSRNVTFDEDGRLMNRDRSVCDATRADGTDNGFLSVVEESVEWHQQFIGQYSLGDFQYRNYTCVNSGTCMYWKVGKNFATDLTTQHIDNAWLFGDTAMSGAGGSASIHGPAGAFSFNARNVNFYGHSSFGIGAGQHCGIIGEEFHTTRIGLVLQLLLWQKEIKKIVVLLVL